MTHKIILAIICVNLRFIIRYDAPFETNYIYNVTDNT